MGALIRGDGIFPPEFWLILTAVVLSPIIIILSVSSILKKKPDYKIAYVGLALNLLTWSVYWAYLTFFQDAA